MKFFKTAVAAFALALCVGTGANAQNIGTTRWGIIGGFTSSSADANIFKAESYSLYHAGLTFQLPLIAGFSIQPSVTYQMKGAKLDVAAGDITTGINALDTKVGYLEIPVQVQWGPDLILFRPYLMAEPFVGFALNSKTVSGSMKETNLAKAALNKMEYGLGLGGGVEIWRLQVSARYYWNFGSLCDSDGSVNPIGQEVRTAFKNGKNFNGFSLSAAIFF
jgi:hypothetical protein